MIPRVAALTLEQQGQVQELAVAELTRQKDRLVAYTTQARFAVAQLYDRAALARNPGCSSLNPTSRALQLLALSAALALAGCASKRAQDDDKAPTLKTLSGREADVPEDMGIKADVGDAIAAYRKFLETAPKAQQRTEAMRRWAISKWTRPTTAC